MPSLNNQSHSPARTLQTPSCDLDCFPDAGPHLRSAFHIPIGAPIDLSVIPDPPPGERPSAQLESLVQLAIYASPQGRLTLQEIYSAIENRFEYYRNTNSRWKASIRHMLSLKSIFVSTPRPPSVPGRGSYWKLNPGVTIRFKRPRKRRSISHGRTGGRPQTLLSRSPKSESSSSWEDFDDDNQSVFQQVYTFPTTESDATSYNFCQEMKSVLAVTPNATPLLRFSPSPPPSTSPFVDQSSLNLPLPSTSYFSDVRYPGICEEDSSASNVPSEVWWGQIQNPGLLPNLDLNSYSPPSDFHGLPRTIRFPFPPSNYTQ